MELILQIKIPNYPRKILLSKGLMKKYYHPGDRVPDKYLHKVDSFIGDLLSARDRNGNHYFVAPPYDWRKVGGKWRLYDTATKEDVVKNASKLGKEKWEQIDGGKIFAQVYHEFTRKRIVDTIKTYFKEELRKLHLPPITRFPISLHYHYTCYIADNADLDNYSLPYHKTFQDALVEVGIIPNDTISYINGLKITFTPIHSIDLVVETWGQPIVEDLTVKIYANRIQESPVHATGEDRRSSEDQLSST